MDYSELKTLKIQNIKYFDIQINDKLILVTRFDIIY